MTAGANRWGCLWLVALLQPEVTRVIHTYPQWEESQATASVTRKGEVRNHVLSAWNDGPREGHHEIRWVSGRYALLYQGNTTLSDRNFE